MSDHLDQRLGSDAPNLVHLMQQGRIVQRRCVVARPADADDLGTTSAGHKPDWLLHATAKKHAIITFDTEKLVSLSLDQVIRGSYLSVVGIADHKAHARSVLWNRSRH